MNTELIPLQVKEQVGKLSFAILFVYGTLIFLAPQKTKNDVSYSGLNLYLPKVQLKDPNREQSIKYLSSKPFLIHFWPIPFVLPPWLCEMTVAVEWYLFNVVGWSPEKAIGICTLPWILLCLHAILNENSRKMGYKNPGKLEYQILLMNAITAYVTLFADDDAMVLSSFHYSNLAVKVLSGYVLANGIGLYFFSTNAIPRIYYFFPSRRESFVVNVRKVYGIVLINSAVFQYGILAGMDNINLLGLVWFIAFVLFSGLLKDFQRTEREMKPIYAWWVTMFLFSVILLA